MLSLYIALICLSRPLFAVELFIYPSFTEVRQVQKGIGAYTYQFTNDEYGNIIDGSISWDGTPFVRQEVYNTIESLKDAKVTVRRSTACECATIEAKIVDPKTMLLQNLNTGAYFYADKESIEYRSTRPDNGGTALAFQFNNNQAEHSGTLSYLMTEINWAPNYDLFFTNNNENNLRAYANIKNNEQREYTVENTNLIGGDVQLASSHPNFQPNRFESSMKAPGARPIHATGEQQGLYSYSLNDKYTLRPLSSVRLPFIDIVAKCRFYYKTTANIATGQYQGVFQRNYDLIPNHYMPAGIITIRDNHVLVGQSNLPNVPENYTQTISVGQDNDVRYSLNGNMTSQNDENATVLWQTYELDVQIMNFKDKPVETELVLSGGVQITPLGTTCKSIKVNGNQLQLPVQLQKGEKHQCKLNITVKLN